jgi:hypothetical protein
MSSLITRTRRLFRPLALVLGLLIVAAPLAGCAGSPASRSASSAPASASTDGLKMAPMADMPAKVKSAPATVQQAYQFAVANPDVMMQVPCYCGCGAMGHTSNYACYVAGQNADGSTQFDSHALGCSLCVDITQDTMRLLREGKSVKDIRAYVDGKYSQYGPSNMPALAPALAQFVSPPKTILCAPSGTGCAVPAK